MPVTAKKIIFNAKDVAARLAFLKKNASDPEGPWWNEALKFEWASARKGNNGTQWVSLSYTDENGLTGRLVVRVNGERHCGQIKPSTDAGLTELAARMKNRDAKLEKRTRKPAIQIQKWNARVKTAEDGLTPLTDEDGIPILPSDEDLSPYFQAASLIDEAFAFEAKLRIHRGLSLAAKITEMKKRDKTTTAQAVLDAFIAENGPRRPNDIILSSETVSAMRRPFANPKDAELLLRGAIIATNTKIAPLVQEFISDQAPKNAGRPLPNPMTRVTMDFDTATGLPKGVSFFDKNLPYTENGRQKFEVGKVDGDPINADNVHLFVLSGSKLDGIINMDSVCFSSMGISMPVKTEILVVAQPEGRESSLDDVYGEDLDPAPVSAAISPTTTKPSVARNGTQPPSAAAHKSAPPPAEEETDYAALLEELEGAAAAPRGKK